MSWGTLGTSRFIWRAPWGLRYDVMQYHPRVWMAVERDDNGAQIRMKLPFDSSQDARDWCEAQAPKEKP